MTCTKTGCHIYLVPYREFAYGDAFEIEPILEADKKVWRELHQMKLTDKIKNTAYFRLVGRSFFAINSRDSVDYIVHDWDNWFNPGQIEGRLSDSTLITNNFLRKLTPIGDLS